MPTIDWFVSALYKSKAQQLRVSTGQPALLIEGQARKAITREATSDKLFNMIREVSPSAENAFHPGNSPFTYDSPVGPVQIHCLLKGEQIHVMIERGGSDEREPRAAPTPAPASTPAPAGSPVARVELRSTPAPRAGAPAMETFFLQMHNEGCSDVHISAGSPPMFRRDGDMVVIGDPPPLTPENTKELLEAIMPAKSRAEFEELNDTDFAYEIPGLARFRCNIFLDRRGMGGVFRIIPSELMNLKELGFSDAVISLCHLPKGLVLVTGPTGSGKSTSLAAMIDYINQNKRGHIITIEDPIEFTHENKGCLVNQREVGVHTKGFKPALRAALREDPDIVLVGELRDLETVAIAIETAETGHLVFATLHTNTAPSTVDRLIDQFPEGQQAQIRAMLSESLKGVITQTLCKKKGGGRIPAFEILIVNNAVANLIREGKTYQIPSAIQTGRALGMVQMNDALLTLVKTGKVAATEAYEKAVEKDTMKKMLADAGHRVG